jgi:hypothetical protein
MTSDERCNLVLARGGRLYEADRSDTLWTYDHVKQFFDGAPKHLHLMLALWTGNARAICCGFHGRPTIANVSGCAERKASEVGVSRHDTRRRATQARA